MREGDAADPVERAEAETVAEPMVAVYRHDVHKLRGRRHGSAGDAYEGVRVNESVPLGADRDAALLSRPEGEPEETVANHVSPVRVSLLTGEPVVDALRLPEREEVEELVMPADPRRLHSSWVGSEVAAMFNESPYYPYTSLKFHVLLTAALLDNYRAGFAFDELWVAVTAPDWDAESAAAVSRVVDAEAGSDPSLDRESVVESGWLVPHRTVLWTPAFALHITGEPGDRPAARLGAEPTRSFADVWSRVAAHPVEADTSRAWRMLDSELRRIRSWSSALQYIEDYVSKYGFEGPDPLREEIEE